MSNQEIKVSVSILSYNHEKFIIKAIDSVLKQKVDFNYEIIIGDDCSSDNTRAILKKYKDLYPEKISLILHPERYNEIPGRTNNITNIYACKGKYIALLDGDDYWIDEDKLQRQVDFLDDNSDHVLAFHDTYLVSEERKFTQYLFSDEFKYLDKDRSFQQKDLVKEWFVPTSTVVFRNNLFPEFPEWFRKVYSADFALLLLISEHGKMRFFKDIFSVWRRNDNSFSAKIPLKSQKGIKMRLTERKIFRDNFPLIEKSKTPAQFYFIHSVLLARTRSYFKMGYYILKCLKHDPKFIKKYLKPLSR